MNEKGNAVQILGIDDTLTAPNLLPNFELPLKDIFVTILND